jgi:hypothetical protein
MEKIVSLCKRRGFIFQSSEIMEASMGFGITVRWASNLSATSRTLVAAQCA